MKKILLIMLMAAAAIVQAQTNVTNGSMIVNGNANDLFEPIEADLDVVNTNNVMYSMKVKRVVGNQASGSANYFCWKVCYGPNITVSPDTLNLDAGGRTSLFHGYYVPNGATALSTIQYVFFNFNDPNDSVYVNITYDPLATSTVTTLPYVNLSFTTSIKEVKNSGKMMAYTDNKQERIFINSNGTDLSGDASVILYDLTGKKVAEYNMNNSIGISSYTLPKLTAGIYCCAVVDKGSIQMTKKIFIK